MAKRSRTAQGVVLERAVLTDMGVLADPFAQQLLSPANALLSRFIQRWPYQVRARSVTLAAMAARVLWFDAQVADALDAGIRQVAIIGAGYDSRAWRFGRGGVRFFELDHGATQQDKAERAPQPGPTYIDTDLMAQGAAESLQEHGLDPSRPALFVFEGVTMYLGEDVVRRQLSDLANTSGTGSRLAVDFQPPHDAGASLHHRQNRLQRLARAGSGEVFRLLVERPQATELVETSGWDVTEATTMRDVALTLVPPESGLPTDAVNGHKTLIAGQLS